MVLSKATHKGLFISVIAVLAISFILINYKSYPSDDFLRHVRYMDYKPLGGYGFMFPFSRFEGFHFNQWFGFDWLAGTIAQNIGSRNTILLFQIAFIGLFYIAILYNIRRGRQDDTLPFDTLLLLVLLSFEVKRLLLIRPAIAVGILFFLFINGKGFFKGLFFPLVGAFFYHLFFLYSIPLAVSHLIKGDRKYGIGILTGTAMSLAIWAILTDFEFIESVLLLLRGATGGRNEIVVPENMPFVGALGNPVAFFISLFFLATVYRFKVKDLYLVLVIVTFPLAIQMRYFADLSLPLMTIYIARNNADLHGFFLNNRQVLGALSLLAVMLIVPSIEAVSQPREEIAVLKGINIPRGSIVFTENMPLNFSVVFWNKEPVRVIPSCEIGWNDSETKTVIKSILNNRTLPDNFCSYVKQKGIRYVLTQHWMPAKCLTHIQTFSRGKETYLWAVTSPGQ